jgi:hypothetical protein
MYNAMRIGVEVVKLSKFIIYILMSAKLRRELKRQLFCCCNKKYYLTTGLDNKVCTFLMGSVLLVALAFLCCVFVVFVFDLCLVYPMLPGSLACSFLIAPSVFSIVYLFCLSSSCVLWKPKGQSRMDNPENLATLGTYILLFRWSIVIHFIDDESTSNTRFKTQNTQVRNSRALSPDDTKTVS